MNPTATRGIAPVDARTLPEYAPTTYLDFSQPEPRAAFEKALDRVRAELGAEHAVVIGGQASIGPSFFASTNPAKPSQVIGRFTSGTREQATAAVGAAEKAFATWSRVPAAGRAADLI